MASSAFASEGDAAVHDDRDAEEMQAHPRATIEGATPEKEHAITISSGEGPHPALAAKSSRGALFLLLPTETGGSKAVDEMFCDMAHRLPHSSRIVVLGVAPAPTRLMRMVPFGIARKNRLSDADALTTRADRIVANLIAQKHTDVTSIIVAEGDASVPAVVMDIAAKHNLTKVFMDRGAPVVVVFSEAEKCIRELVPNKIPVTVFKSLPLQSAYDMTHGGQFNPPLHHTPRRALVVVDANDFSVRDLLPGALLEALATSMAGDGVVIYCSIALPEVSEALQLSQVDWAAELRRAAKDADRHLADLKGAALKALSRRADGGKAITVGTYVTERHYAQGVPKAVADFKASHVFLSAEFMRQRIFRGAYESLYGSEYERLMKMCPDVHFTVAA